jgi:hypothetical protein
MGPVGSQRNVMARMTVEDAEPSNQVAIHPSGDGKTRRAGAVVGSGSREPRSDALPAVARLGVATREPSPIGTEVVPGPPSPSQPRIYRQQHPRRLGVSFSKLSGRFNHGVAFPLPDLRFPDLRVWSGMSDGFFLALALS